MEVYICAFLVNLGDITLYRLYQNNLLTFVTSHELEHVITGLLPFSLHYLRLEACTARGCGSSVTWQARTAEAPPVGELGLDVLVIGSRDVQAYWNAVEKMNGILHYDVYAEGSYYIDPGTN